MSRIAKNSIAISDSITCKFENGSFYAKGKLGEMTLTINDLFKLEIKDKEIMVIPKEEKDKSNPNWGTTRSLVNNIIQGVDKGFTKTLERNLLIFINLFARGFKPLFLKALSASAGLLIIHLMSNIFCI